MATLQAASVPWGALDRKVCGAGPCPRRDCRRQPRASAFASPQRGPDPSCTVCAPPGCASPPPPRNFLLEGDSWGGG